MAVVQQQIASQGPDQQRLEAGYGRSNVANQPREPVQFVPVR
jgi:hypothetical protein